MFPKLWQISVDSPSRWWFAGMIREELVDEDEDSMPSLLDDSGDSDFDNEKLNENQVVSIASKFELKTGPVSPCECSPVLPANKLSSSSSSIAQSGAQCAL